MLVTESACWKQALGSVHQRRKLILNHQMMEKTTYGMIVLKKPEIDDYTVIDSGRHLITSNFIACFPALLGSTPPLPKGTLLGEKIGGTMGGNRGQKQECNMKKRLT
jgi:hypothetical protein